MTGMVLFTIINVVSLLALVVGFIVFLVASWKLMRAHQAIAVSLQNIADALADRAAKPPALPDSGPEE